MKSLLLGWALGFSLLALPAAAQDFPKLSGRVVDQADIIPAAEEANLTVQLEQLEKSTGHQLVVATVNSLDGNDISDYGYKLGRAWGIGGKENNDGVVFLIAPNERRMNISVGYGLEPVLTDALSGRIIRDVVTPKFKAGDMPGGIQDGVNAIAEQIQLPPEEAAARAAKAAKAERDRADQRRGERDRQAGEDHGPGGHQLLELGEGDHRAGEGDRADQHREGGGHQHERPDRGVGQVAELLELEQGDHPVGQRQTGH